MIHAIGVDLQAKLRAVGCPFLVVDGSADNATNTFARERIVIDYDGSDSFSFVRGVHSNPKHRMIRAVSAKITIYAQRAASGALYWEHAERAEHVLDLVLVALDELTRKGRLNVNGGGFIRPDDLAESERPKGAVYELTFTIDRAVVAQTWAGEAEPEVALGGVSNTTNVSLFNGAGADPEVSCGG